MKLYLSHPTSSRHSVREIEQEIEQKTQIDLINPFYDLNGLEVNKVDKGEWNIYDKRIPTYVVNNDLNAIDECDGLLAIIDNNIAVGLFMEIFYAKEHYKPIIAICTNDKLRYHPWLRYCVDKFFENKINFINYWTFQKWYNIKIGICGQKENGKDIIAKHLVEKYGFKQFAFADEIKRTIKNINNLSQIRMENKDSQLRKLMQITGDKLREIDSNIFINSLLSKIDNYKKVLPIEYSKIVISDVRLLNEANYLKENGFEIWKVVRESKLNLNDNHITETEVNEIKPYITFYNNGPIEELLTNIDKIMKQEILHEK